MKRFVELGGDHEEAGYVVTRNPGRLERVPVVLPAVFKGARGLEGGSNGSTVDRLSTGYRITWRILGGYDPLPPSGAGPIGGNMHACSSAPGRRGRPLAWAAVPAAVILAVLTLLPTSGAASAFGPRALAGPGHPAAPRAAPPTVFPPSHWIQHVVIIVMENHALYQVDQGGHYERYLAGRYAAATHYYAACHPSVPNYLAMTSGATHQCGTDNYAMYGGTNVGDLFQNSGRTWGSYLESMPSACTTSSSGVFTTHHDPFIAYSDVVTNAPRCASHVQNSRVFNASVVNGTLRNYSLYIPNMNDDCHNTPIPTCDHWLKQFLSPILNTTRPAELAMVLHTVFFVTYDESVANDTKGYNGLVGGHVFFVAISPWSLGIRFPTDSTHYDLLSTLEWIFGLGSCGHHDGTTAYPAMKGLFVFP